MDLGRRWCEDSGGEVVEVVVVVVVEGGWGWLVVGSTGGTQNLGWSHSGNE